jgi:hypothetical protein
MDPGGPFTELTDKERKQLKRSQFAFGSLFPFISDGLLNGATHFGKSFSKMATNITIFWNCQLTICVI